MLKHLYYTWLAVADVRRDLLPRLPNNHRYMAAYTRVYCKFNHFIDLTHYFGGQK